MNSFLPKFCSRYGLNNQFKLFHNSFLFSPTHTPTHTHTQSPETFSRIKNLHAWLQTSDFSHFMNCFCDRGRELRVRPPFTVLCSRVETFESVYSPKLWSQMVTYFTMKGEHSSSRILFSEYTCSCCFVSTMCFFRMHFIAKATFSFFTLTCARRENPSKLSY